MRFSVVNLGCKVNRVESDSYEAALAAAGWQHGRPEEADVIIVNTCTVTGEAEKKTRKAVRAALRANPQARVLATGCAAAIAPDALRTLSERVEVVAKADMEPALAVMAAHSSAPARAFALERMRAGVKVQDGCDNACTFCIVHVARGRARSVPWQRVQEECCDLARQGVREVVLTGINLATYRDDGMRLTGLLERLLGATEELRDEQGRACRFRISSVEPADVDDELIELLDVAQGRVCRHLHLPLQSGSSAVLRQMARPYDAEGFLDLVARLRAVVPAISLTTDVIAGFPGESAADHAQSMRAARTVRFSKMHVFPYSPRAGTPAAARTDQVASEVKAQRAFELRALSEELRIADYRSRCGAVERCVVESAGRARTESYHEVRASAAARPGSFADILLTEEARVPAGRA